MESSAPHQVEARTKVHIVDMLDSGRLLEILTRVQEIALSTLKSQKPSKLSQIEEMCIKLACDLTINELKKPPDVKKQIDTQDDAFEFDPKNLLAEHLKNTEAPDSEVSGLKRIWA